jgi:transposase-like protein
MSTYNPKRREYFRAYMAKRRSGVKNGRRLSDAQKAEIVRLYTVEKLGTDPIGDRLGCDGSTVCYWLKKLGVRLRAQGRFRDTMPSARTLRMTGIRTQASIAAATFHQETIISFPESPQLQADWEHVLAQVREERGNASAAERQWGLG